jgi:hypothetical protein
MKIADCRKYQEKQRFSPPPPQDVNHPPPAKMTYTEGAANLVPDSAARWRASESILANNIQRSNKERRYNEETTTRLRPRKNTPTHINAKSVNNIKTQQQYNQATRTQYFNSMRCSRKDQMTGKQLYEANHLCMMNSNY